jgi:hypothetical protein
VQAFLSFAAEIRRVVVNYIEYRVLERQPVEIAYERGMQLFSDVERDPFVFV